MNRAFDVLELLSSKEYRSGESLAAKLGVSRVAIWRQIERLKKTGVDIISVSGQGYKILAEFEMLDAVKIYKNLANAGGINSSSIQVSKVVEQSRSKGLSDDLYEPVLIGLL